MTELQKNNNTSEKQPATTTNNRERLVVRQIQHYAFAHKNILLLLLISLSRFLLLEIVNALSHYQLFADEFYYLECAQHLAFGYVDHPPLIALVTKLMLLLLGNSLVAVRFLPSLAGAATVFLVGLMASELGGKIYSQVLAAIVVGLAPVYLGLNGFLTTIGYDHFFWALSGYFVIRLIKSGNPRWWLAIGAAFGLGLMTKHNIMFLLAGLFVGLIITSNRKYFKSYWFWLGLISILVIVTPNIIWQFQNNFATLQFLQDITDRYQISPIDFLTQQILALNPLALPIWAAGVYYYGFSKKVDSSFRLMFWLCCTPEIILTTTQKARLDYITPIFLLLIPAGAVVIEEVLKNFPKFSWAKPTILGLFVVSNLVSMPLAIGILPPSALATYSQALGLSGAGIDTDSTNSALPEFFARSMGWQEATASVAKVYYSLTPQEQSNTTILAGYFGTAGAINYYGGKFSLPPAVSGNDTYFLWGPDEAKSDEIAIVVGPEYTATFIQQFYGDVKQVATINCGYCAGAYKVVPIYLARLPKAPINSWWYKLKDFS